jgi:uncharacterized protein YutE (UPF0331/DUF86 family)
MKSKKLRATLIRSKLAEIEESIELVSEHIPESFDDFSKLGLVKDGIYKRTEFAIENVFDICAIISSDLTLEIPESEEDIIENLADKSILNKETTEKLRKMKGFRNIMVHRYGRIDDRIAYSILRTSLNDFHTFTEMIEDFLKSKGC